MSVKAILTSCTDFPSPGCWVFPTLLHCGPSHEHARGTSTRGTLYSNLNVFTNSIYAALLRWNEVLKTNPFLIEVPGRALASHKARHSHSGACSRTNTIMATIKDKMSLQIEAAVFATQTIFTSNLFLFHFLNRETLLTHGVGLAHAYMYIIPWREKKKRTLGSPSVDCVFTVSS